MIITYNATEGAIFANIGSEYYSSPWYSDSVWMIPGTYSED